MVSPDLYGFIDMTKPREKEIWCFADCRNEPHFTESLKVLSLARRLGDEVHAATGVVVAGSSQQRKKPSTPLALEAISLGSAFERLTTPSAPIISIKKPSTMSLAEAHQCIRAALAP
jgi:hypothetical protein